MKLSTRLAMLSVLLTFTSFAQEDFDPESQNFFQYRSERILHYDSVRTANSGNMHGTGFTQFLRWMNYWTPLITNDGSMANSMNAMHNTYGNHASSAEQVSNSLWTEIGPMGTPQADPGSNTFSNNRILGSGRLHFLEFDDINNRILCGSPASGLFYSEDGGSTWLNGGMDHLDVIGASHAQIAKNINSGQTWFVITGDGEGAWRPSNGIWRTTDKGQNWDNISTNNQLGIGSFPNFFWARCRKILIHPTNADILYAAFGHGIYKTTNATASPASSVTWTKVLDATLHGGGFLDIQFKPNDLTFNTIVVSGRQVCQSTNAGSSWSLLLDYSDLGKSTAQEDYLISIRFAESDGDILYGAWQGNVFKFDFGNSSISNHNPGTSHYSRHQAIGVSPTDEDEVSIGNVGYFYKSTNGGSSYSTMTREYHDDLHWIEYRSANEIWITNDGGVYKTMDGGTSWTNLSSDMGLAIYFNMSSSESAPYDIIGGGWDTGPNLHEASTSDFKWTGVFGDAFESWVTEESITPTYYVTASNTNFYKIAPGASPTSINIPSSIGSANWFQSFVISGEQQDIIYYCGINKIGRSTNAGSNWSPISFDPTGGGLYPDRMFAEIYNNPAHENFLYAKSITLGDPLTDPGAMGLYVTKNATASSSTVSWTDISPTDQNGTKYRKSIAMVAVDDEDPNKIWAVHPGYTIGYPKVMLYEDGLWSDISGTGLEDVSIFSVAHQEGSEDIVFVGTSHGVYYKKDHETAWTFMPGLPNCNVTDIEVNHCASKVRVSTMGRGIWEADLPQPTSLASTVDLFMKDNLKDMGQSPSPGIYTDAGPDIWYRNNSDGLTNFEPEALTYNGTSFWVYVRVRNNSCEPSTAGRELNLYWSRLGSAFSWPTEWDGTTANGDQIGGTAVLPAIPAGGSTIVEFEWDMSGHVSNFPNSNISSCLMARIKGEGNDPLTPYPTLYEEVKKNNNITMKNLVIREAIYLKRGGDGILSYIGGGHIEDEVLYDIVFNLPQSESYTSQSIFAAAEVVVELDQDTWDKWESTGSTGSGITVLSENDRTILINKEGAIIENLPYDPEERTTITTYVNFLTEEISDETEFPFTIAQQTLYEGEPVVVGAVHFEIIRSERTAFYADAGFDRYYKTGESVTLSSNIINENAQYNWYNSSGQLVSNQPVYAISNPTEETYTLEIIADSDGFKDYDEVEVYLTETDYITSVAPNPTQAEFGVEYTLPEEALVSVINIVQINSGTLMQSVTVEQGGYITLNVSGYSTGLYEVMLISDNVVLDTETLVKQ